MILICSAEFMRVLGPVENADFFDSADLAARRPEWEARLHAGEDLIFLGTQGLEFMERYWIFAAEPGVWYLRGAASEGVGDIRVRTAAKILYVRPPDPYTLHGIHSEPRAEVTEWIRASDSAGNPRGAAGLMLRHFDDTLAEGGSGGARRYFCAAENPAAVWDAAAWRKWIFERAAAEKLRCRIKSVQPLYPLYRPGETVHVFAEVDNRSDEIRCARLRLTLEDEAGNPADTLCRDLALNPGEVGRVHAEFFADEGLCGILRIRAELSISDRFVYGEKRRRSERPADSAVSSVYVKPRDIPGPAVRVEGGALTLDGRRECFLGTHFYPSSAFPELSYRPLKPARAFEEIRNMKRCGLSLVRLWADPVADETSLRAMECVLDFLAQNGMGAVLTLYTSWWERSEIRTREQRLELRVEAPEDDRFIGLIPEDPEKQELYFAFFGRRFGQYRNIVWDLTNEFSVCLPEEGPKQAVERFDAWARRMTAALRRFSDTPVLRGVSCWDTGSDNYECTKDGDLTAAHYYGDANGAETVSLLTRSDRPGKPWIVEEFGGTWPEPQRRAEYDRRLHRFMASGASAILNYEWGVSELIDRLPGRAPDLKHYAGFRPEDLPDRFLFTGRFAYAETWTAGSVGICPWAASFEYGINYPCTGGFTPTQRLLMRISRIAADLKPTVRIQKTALVIPSEFRPFRPGLGFNRVREKYEAVARELRRRGILFNVVQESEIERIPEETRYVIFPNSRPPAPQTARVLAAFRSAGKTVFTGDDEISWDRLPRVPVSGSGAFETMICETEDGRALFFFSHDDLSEIRYRNAVLRFREVGLLRLRNEEIVAAEGCGLAVGDRNVFATDARAYVRSEDGRPLDRCAALALLPFEAGRFEVGGEFRFLRIRDSRGCTRMRNPFDGSFEAAPDATECDYVAEAGDEP